MPAVGDVVLPVMSPVVFAGTAAVPVCLPAVAGAVPPAGFTWGGGGVTDELPADFAEVAAVRVASSAEAGEITFGVAGMDSAGSVSQVFSDVADDQIAVGGSTLTAVVPVNTMVNMQTDNFGDDREHPEFLGNDSDSSEDRG